MKRTFILVILLGFCSLNSSGQSASINTQEHLRSVQLELGGSGFIYSFAYEKFIAFGDRYKTAAQIGFSALPATNQLLLLAPLSITELFSFNSHHIELGLGFILAKTALFSYGRIFWRPTYFYSSRIGYRYQKPGSDFLFRIGFTPYNEMDFSFNDISLTGGIAVGFCF